MSSSLLKAGIGQSTSKAEGATHHDVNASNAPPASSSSSTRIHTRDSISSEFVFTPDTPCSALAWPQWPPPTRATSHQPSEWSDTQTTMFGWPHDGGVFDKASSSITLQDEFPWHDVDVNKYPYRMPTTICPALLMPAGDISLASAREAEVDPDANDPDDAPSRYSAQQKGKWKAQPVGDVAHDSDSFRQRSPSPEIILESPEVTVEEWVVHNKPILQDYADRQITLPLGSRLEVSIDEPSQLVLGTLHLLVNRDPKGCTDPRRQIGPQLIENFVDTDRWAKEYFRSRHGAQAVGSDVTTLLTVVMNSFFEGQVQLIDRLVESAFENMHISGRSTPALEDFAFGFDFKMSHDFPFDAKTSSRIRKPLPIRAVPVQPTLGPVTTNSGRQVKPSARAQAAAEQTPANPGAKRNKEKKTIQVKDKQAASALARSKKNVAQPASDLAVQDTLMAHFHVAGSASTTASGHTRYRPIRPSNLRGPATLPGSLSTPGKTSSQAKDGSKATPEVARCADRPNITEEASRSAQQQPRLMIKLRAPRLPASTAAAIGSTESSSSDTQTSSITKALETTLRGGPCNERENGREHDRGKGSLTLCPEAAPPAAPDNAVALLMPHIVDSGTAGAPAAVDTPVGNPIRTPNDALGGKASDTRDDRRCTRQSLRTRKRPLQPSDPDHPQRNKKRKLNEGND